MMKRYFFGIIALSLLLAGCQKSEVTGSITNDENQIRVTPYLGQSNTKVAEMNIAALQTASAVGPTTKIPVYAYSNGDPTVYTFNENLAYIGGKWTTDVPRFFPVGGNLSFYSYYPTTGVSNYVAKTTTAYPSFDFLVGTPPSQVDLVVANNPSVTSKSVALAYRHALSQVNFAIQGYYGAQITIDSIVVNNIKENGKYTFNDGASTNPDKGVWSYLPANSPSTNDYTYRYASGDNTFTTPGTRVENLIQLESSSIYVLGDGGNYGPSINRTPANDPYLYITGPTTFAKQGIGTPRSNSLMLLPQTHVTGNTVVFKYTVKDLNNNVIFKNAIGTFDLSQLPTSVEGSTAVPIWKQNKRYLYIIDLSDVIDNQSLIFNVTVISWENWNAPGDGEKLVTMPIGTTTN